MGEYIFYEFKASTLQLELRSMFKIMVMVKLLRSHPDKTVSKLKQI